MAARNLLTRSDPEDVAAAAGARPPVADPARVGTMEIVTVILLLIGGIVIPVIGWVAGVVLLWASPRLADRRPTWA